MPKRRKKQNVAWNALRKQHIKGPKRLRLPVVRQKKGINPLLVPGNVKKIQIWYSESCNNKLPISVVVFKRAFEQLGLRPSVDISMQRDRLTRSGCALRKTFNLFSRNDRIFDGGREMRLDGIVGRCLVFTQPFDQADAILRILPSTEEIVNNVSTKAYVESLFSPKYWMNRSEKSHSGSDTNVEYM